MPQIGERIFVRPPRNEQVLRGAGLHGQFIPPEGMEVTVDTWIASRLQDGSLHVEAPVKPEEVSQ